MEAAGILESFIKGKKQEEELCEDRIVVTPYYIAVIDGVTSKTAALFKGQTPGRRTACILGDIMEGWSQEMSIDDAIESMTAALMSEYEALGIRKEAEKEATQRLSASVIIYSRSRREIWSIGDCQCMIGETRYTYPKKVDTVIEEARALYIAAELSSGRTVEELLEHDTAREFVMPLIKKAVSFQNCTVMSPYAYGVIDGFAVNRCCVHVEHAEKGDMIVLASDGYPMLYGTLQESENYLQYMLKNDPLCYDSFRSTKGIAKGAYSFDDRSYIRFVAD